LLGAVSLFGAPYAVLMPIFSDQVLHHGASALGLLMGSSGVGALLAAISLAARTQLRGLGRWVASSTVGFGASLILFGLSRSFWLSAALLVPLGFAMMIEMAASNTLIQAMVPDHLRGRVMAVYSIMVMGMAPIGALIAGSVAQRLGARAYRNDWRCGLHCWRPGVSLCACPTEGRRTKDQCGVANDCGLARRRD
jgi:MFS family permease